MRLLRFEFEAPTGFGWNGPYSSEAMYAYERYANAHDNDTCPGPRVDGLYDLARRHKTSKFAIADGDYDWARNWCFGFKDEAQLVAWFWSAKGRIAMAKLCPLWAFDCPEQFIVQTQYQLAFIRSEAIRLSRLDPISFKEI